MTTTHESQARRARTARALNVIADIRPDRDGELTSRLLVAIMLVPLVESLLGWRVHAPLQLPLALHLGILAAIVLLAPHDSPHQGRRHVLPRAVVWLWVPAFAVVLAFLLSARSNIFYTSRNLMDGMAVLLFVHFLTQGLRHRALRQREATLTGAAILQRGRASWFGNREPVVHVPLSAAVRASDAMTRGVGWSLLAAWLLIALEHRHPAGPILLLGGALAALALVMLLPDSLPISRRPVWVDLHPLALHARRAHRMLFRRRAAHRELPNPHR